MIHPHPSESPSHARRASHRSAAMPATFPAALFAALLAGTLLSACGGGGNGGGGNIKPLPTPSVAGSISATNTTAIDPTLAFRALDEVALSTAASGFTVEKTVPEHPAPVIRIDPSGTYAGRIPDDLEAMTARAVLLWTRRLTNGGSHRIDLEVGDPDGDCQPAHLACAEYEGDRGVIALPDKFFDRSSGSRLTNYQFGIILHEVGHTLSYRDPRGEVHPQCRSGSTQLMCPEIARFQSLEPTEADFSGLRHKWAVGSPAGDHQEFGLWAQPVEDSGLEGFGVTLTRTLASSLQGIQTAAAAGSITDTIRIVPRVDGTPGPGPAPGLGTATWSGTFLGAQSRLFQPVTGDATLTANLANLSKIDLGLSGLFRTDAGGRRHQLSRADYELDRHGNTWVDAARRADARFYAAGGDSAGSAAGIVNDTGRSLVGAWGARRRP